MIRFWAAILLAASLSGCVTRESKQPATTASISSGNEYKIILIPVPIYLSNPDRGDEDKNSGEVIPPERSGHAVHARLLNLSEPDFHP